LVPTNQSPASFSVGGTTYFYSKKAVSFVASSDVYPTPMTKIVYFDSVGNAIKVAGPSAGGPAYGVLLNKRTIAGSGWQGPSGGNTYEAQLLITDGTIITVPIDATDYPIPLYSVVTYGTVPSGLTDLSNPASPPPVASPAVINRGTVTFTAGSATNNRANANTIFFVQATPPSGVPTYSVYIGILSIPSITGSADSTVYTIPVAQGGSGFATVVFVKDAVWADTGVVSTDVIYVYGPSGSPATDVDGSYFTYFVVKNGIPDTMEVVDTSAGAFSAGGRLLSSVTKNDKGRVISGSDIVIPNTSTKALQTGVGTNAASDGVVKFGSTEVTFADK
jgi:hypothetical protein